MKKPRPGPKESTGIFETREELEKEALRRLKEGDYYKQIAADYGVCATTIVNIRKASESKKDNFGDVRKRVVSQLWNRNFKLNEEESLCH